MAGKTRSLPAYITQSLSMQSFAGNVASDMLVRLKVL